MFDGGSRMSHPNGQNSAVNHEMLSDTLPKGNALQAAGLLSPRSSSSVGCYGAVNDVGPLCGSERLGKTLVG